MFKKITTKKLVLCGMFIALDILLSRFLTFRIGPSQRMSLQFLAHSMCGFYLGPVLGALTMMASDVIGFLINSGGYAFFPGYILSAALSGIIYGLMLHDKPVKLWRTVASVSTVTLIVTALINNYWTSIFMATPFWTVVVAKLPFTAIYWVVACVVTYIVLTAVSKIDILNPAK